MKTLIPTKFTEDKDPTSKKTNLICPSCRKTLTNSLKICCKYSNSSNTHN